MPISDLEKEANMMSTSELAQSLDWHEALANHSGENMDFNGYQKCQEKIRVIKAELNRRLSR